MDEALRERIKTTIDSHRVVLFMKGNKNFPQCGFSAQVIGLLKQNGAEFKDVNIMGVAHGTDKQLVLAHKAAIDQHQRILHLRIGHILFGRRLVPFRRRLFVALHPEPT